MPTLGGDPEVFLINARGDLVPSIGLIGGTKQQGVRVHEGLGKDYTWLEDNVAVEFNFPASTTAPNFMRNVRYCTEYGGASLQPKNLKLKIIPWAKFPNTALIDDKCHVFGCEPDFEAYNYSQDKPPPPRICKVDEMGNLRFAGGHLHLGFANPHNIPAHAVAILCDIFIGLPCLKQDDQGMRRKFYGLAGLYRPKKYGIEYRTMGNWWLHRSGYAEQMAMETFALMMALEKAHDGLAKVFDRIPHQDVRAVINTNNLKEARILWNEVRTMVSPIAGLGDLTRYYDYNILQPL